MRTPRVNSAILAFVPLLACSPSAGTPGRDSSAATPAATTAGQATAAVDSVMLERADRGRIEGSPSAKVWFVIASDFQCPYCRQWHAETFESVRREYVRTGKVRMAYINYPLTSHEQAWPSATAAMCASEQDRFWQYHDALFHSQDKWATAQTPAAVFDSLAQAVGVEMKQWRACVSSDRMRPLIRSDKSRAEAAGVTSTPTFLVGDRGLAGVRSIAELRPVLDSALIRAGSSAR